MAETAGNVQSAFVEFLRRKQLVDGWFSIEVSRLEEGEGGGLEGELFLSRRFHDDVTDDDLGRVCAALNEGFATGEIKVPGIADAFYEERVSQHLQIGIRALELLRKEADKGTLHSRKLRSFTEPAFR